MHIHSECHVQMEAETGVVHRQAKEHQELLASPKARNDVRNRSLEGNNQADTLILDF